MSDARTISSSGPERHEGDDELGQVAEGRVEEPAEGRARAGCDGAPCRARSGWPGARSPRRRRRRRAARPRPWRPAWRRRAWRSAASGPASRSPPRAGAVGHAACRPIGGGEEGQGTQAPCAGRGPGGQAGSVVQPAAPARRTSRTSPGAGFIAPHATGLADASCRGPPAAQGGGASTLCSPLWTQSTSSV